jgi:putative ABC transport system permease protein
MRSVLQDLRYALRQLVKSVGFSMTSLLSLACGIAATTAVFSVVWAVVVEPYPYANADRMAHLAIGAPVAGGYNGFGITVPQWQQLRTVPAIEDSVVIDRQNLTVTGQDLPEDVQACLMSSNGFHFFGVPPALGRGLQPSDAVGGQDPQPVVVLGYAFWQRRYRGEPDILGKTIELGRKTYTVVGVAAKRFTWEDADVYLPLKLTASDDPRTVEIRLRPGVSRAVAAQQMQPLIKEFQRLTPRYYPPNPGPLFVIGLNEHFLKGIGPTLAMLFGAVALLLAIGCGNVSILLLARGTARQHEFAVRMAIGATRRRIIRQLLTESLLLSLAGAALGVVLSYKLVAVIVSLLPEFAFPHEAAIRINQPALLFCVAIALLTGIVFGLSPALRLSRPDVREAMQSGTRRIAGNVSGRLLHHLLIGGQIALTLLLLTTSTVAIRAFLRLTHTPLGYDPHNVMSVGLPLHAEAYPNIQSRTAFVEALRDKVGDVHGVRMVAVSTNATPPDNGNPATVEVLGSAVTDKEPVRVNLVSPGYFPLLRIPLSEGRVWTEAENHNAAKVCVVNQAFVRRYFPQGGAIGHSLRSPQMFSAHPPQLVIAEGAGGPLLIIGVMADKLDQGLSKPVVPEAFVPFTLGVGGFSQLLVRTDGPPLALLHSIGVQIATVDHDQQVAGRVQDLEHWISTQPEYAQGQLVSWLFGGFAALALLLAAVGLYSVVSYTVAQRTNEFGIRMALGAMRVHVLRLVFRSAALSVGIGVGLGMVLSLALRQVLAHLVERGDVAGSSSLLVAVLILGLVAVVASGIPAARATHIEPLEALRYE